MTSEISITDVPDFLKPDVKTIIGNHTFLPEEIIRFGTLYDPQPFHTDPAAAQHSMFGGLCASGWHTASTWMKLQRKSVAGKVKTLRAAGKHYPEFGPSPGIKNLKWRMPVYAGDTITYSNTVIELRKSNSKPPWWLLRFQSDGMNQNDQLVIGFESVVFIKFTKN